MEVECKSCIQSKADELGLQIEITALQLRWDDGGFWVPETVTMQGRGDDAQIHVLQEWLEAELGIDKEKQVLIHDGY
jgi:hypothetical protein